MESFIIEFVGLAGVGKTTICNKLYEELKKREIDCNKINGKIPFIKKVDFRILANSINLIIKTKHRISKKIFSNLLISYASFIKIKYFKEIIGINLSDQGIFQSISTMRKYSNSIEDVWNKKKCNTYGLPNLLIILYSDKDTIIRQRHERDREEISSLEVEEGIKRIERIEHDAKYISILNSRFKYLVLYNDGISDNAGALVNTIISYLEENKIL